MLNLKERVHFILVRTRFAANLGAAARALKNMGFGNLRLVAPQCEVGIEARTWALKGADLLDRARTFPSLESAAADLNLLAGTSERFSPEKASWTAARTFAEQVVPRYPNASIGIVFGPEDNGLSRQEARLCQWLVEVPTATDYPVLNLSQAVLILAYELHLSGHPVAARPILNAAGPEELQGLLVHAQETLARAGFPKRISIPRLMKRLGKIAGRAQLEKEDVKLIRGILNELERKGR